MSCASVGKIDKVQNETNYQIIPKLDTETTSYIGDSLLKEGTSTATEAIILKEDHGAVGWTAFHYKGTYKFVGTKTVNGEIQKIYQGDTVMPGMLTTTYPQIIEKTDGKVYLVGAASSPELNAGEYVKQTVVDVNDYYFEQQLIYTGAEGKILKFTYREFADGTARPAFTVDAVYDLSKENTIRFKGALIEVLEYNNQMIKYKVISGFKS